MKKQSFVMAGLIAVIAGMIFLAAMYGEKNRFDYKKSLEETVFVLDGQTYLLNDLSYYIARQEMKIEKQARVYNAEDTNQYWGLHTNGEFLRISAKKAVLDMAVHDMLLYEEAGKQGVSLSETEREYARKSASDLCYDLADEQKERAGITDELIYAMAEKAALAEKYQTILAKKAGRNFGAFDYNGKAYENMLKKHELEIKEKLWERVSLGNVTLDHRFKE